MISVLAESQQTKKDKQSINNLLITFSYNIKYYRPTSYNIKYYRPIKSTHHLDLLIICINVYCVNACNTILLLTGRSLIMHIALDAFSF